MTQYRTNLKEARLERVAELRLRGYSIHRVAEELESEGLHNPDTGKPYSPATIGLDFVTLDAMWRESALRTTEQHKARILAELEYAKQKAWELNDEKGIALVVKILAREILLLGLSEVKVNSFNVNVDFASLSEDQLRRLAEGESPYEVLGTQPAQVVEGEVVAGSRGASEETSHHVHDSTWEEKKEEAGPGEGRREGGEDG